MKFNKSFPATAYLKAVKLYAEARGLRFFTWTEVQIACRLYNDHAQINN
jgi:hypothetical protein